MLNLNPTPIHERVHTPEHDLVQHQHISTPPRVVHAMFEQPDGSFAYARTRSAGPNPFRREMPPHLCQGPPPSPIKPTRVPEVYLKNMTSGPSLEVARNAHAALGAILKPPRKTGPGHKVPKLSLGLHERILLMRQLLWTYISKQATSKAANGGTWMDASIRTAKTQERNGKPGGISLAGKIRLWVRLFIADPTDLPYEARGGSATLLDNEEFVQELNLHLQGFKSLVKANDVVTFTENPTIQRRFGFKSAISIRTAQQWMHKLDYRWTSSVSGQYTDGHERPSVVVYRQEVFLPQFVEHERHMRRWSTDGIEIDERPGRRTVVWFHDESTFYANDRRRQQWVKADAKAEIRPKGEGASLMVANFVSADYGWCASPDGKDSAQVLFHAGKSKEGWFTSANVAAQTREAARICKTYYPDDDHVFVFDNATTHTARPEGALSARRMPVGTQAWGPEVTKYHREYDAAGNLVKESAMYTPDGKLAKEKIRMEDGFFNGRPQPLYFPDNHPTSPGLFKGMRVILTERGLLQPIEERIAKKQEHDRAMCILSGKTPGRRYPNKLRGECPNFNCAAGATECCQRRVLYEQPDFQSVKSNLEIVLEPWLIPMILLPKFHCELNFIEMCWGYAKRVYRRYEFSSKPADLETNLLASLAAIPLVTIRRFATRALRFMDAYRRGLNGRQAAWASKKYRGHRVLPDSLMVDMEKAGMVEKT